MNNISQALSIILNQLRFAIYSHKHENKERVQAASGPRNTPRRKRPGHVQSLYQRPPSTQGSTYDHLRLYVFLHSNSESFDSSPYIKDDKARILILTSLRLQYSSSYALSLKRNIIYNHTLTQWSRQLRPNVATASSELCHQSNTSRPSLCGKVHIDAKSASAW